MQGSELMMTAITKSVDDAAVIGDVLIDALAQTLSQLRSNEL